MNFSPEWDQRFRADQNLSIWPWSDVVSYVNRYAKPRSEFTRVLELGCGAGANIPFFVKMGMDYSAVEGSEAIVARLHERFPELKSKIVAGDFTQSISFEGPFDLVLDRSAITHNRTEAIKKTLGAVHDRLRPRGLFIGVDWFSVSHQDSAKGDMVDSFTRTNIPTGQFAGVGLVHFSSREHLLELLSQTGFKVARLEQKQNNVVFPEEEKFEWGSWNFVAVKLDR